MIPMDDASTRRDFELQHKCPHLEALAGRASMEVIDGCIERIATDNRATLDCTARTESLEGFATAYTALVQRFWSVARRGRAVSSDEETVRGRLRDLVQELIVGYNLVINDRLQQDAVPDRSGLTRSVERCVRFLGLLVVDSYGRYQAPADRVWYGLHRFFLFAEQQGIQDLEVSRPGSVIPSSILQTYKRILLVALADPYRLAPGDIWVVYQQLDYSRSWVDRCRIGDQPTGEESSGFVLDLGSDDRAKPLLPEEKAFLKTKQNRLVDLHDFVDAIEESLMDRELSHEGSEATGSAERQGSNPGVTIPERGIDDRVGQSALRRALHSWRRSAQRQYPRQPREDWVELIMGFRGVQNYVDELEQPSNGRELRSRSAYRRGRRFFQLIDESSGGLGFHAPKSRMGESIHVGQTVLRTSESSFNERSPVRLGVIRWLNELGDDGVRFGLELFGDQVTSVQIHPSDASVAEPIVGVYARFSIVDEEGGVVVSSPGVYSPSRHLVLERRNQRWTVYATRLLSATMDQELFACRLAR